MTLTATRPAERRTTVFPRPALGGLTAAWCAALATAHTSWALGGRTGLGPGVPDIAERPLVLVHDVLAALVLLVAAALAAGVAAGRVPARHVVATRGAVNAAGVVLLLRGVVGVGRDLVAGVTNEPVGAGWVQDLAFVVAGVLLATLVTRIRR